MLTVETFRKQLLADIEQYLGKTSEESIGKTLFTNIKKSLIDEQTSLNKINETLQQTQINALKQDEQTLYLEILRGHSLVQSIDQHKELLEKDALKIKLHDQFVNFPKAGVNNPNTFNVEAIKIILELKKQSRKNKQKKEFDAYIIDLVNDPPEKPSLKQFLDDLLKTIPESGAKQIQLILKIRTHYTTIDFHLEKDNCQSLILDASNDNSRLDYLRIIQETQAFKKVFLAGTSNTATGNKSADTLQKNLGTCSVFAVDHAFCAARLPNIYNELAQIQASSSSSENFSFISWSSFPPLLIRNSQSETFFKEYEQQHKEEFEASFGGTSEESLKSYLAKHPIEKNEKNQTEASAVNQKFERYKAKFKEFCANHPDDASERLYEIVNRPISIPIQEKALSPSLSARGWTTTTVSYHEKHPIVQSSLATESSTSTTATEKGQEKLTTSQATDNKINADPELEGNAKKKAKTENAEEKLKAIETNPIINTTPTGSM